MKEITIEDVLKKHSGYKETDGTYNLKHHTLFTYKQVRAAMTEYAASLNRQGWTRGEQEKFWDEVEDIFDKHTSPTGGGYEADYTHKGGFIRELKSKYQLMPLPNKPSI